MRVDLCLSFAGRRATEAAGCNKKPFGPCWQIGVPKA
jgi:hypothetical protein